MSQDVRPKTDTPKPAATSGYVVVAPYITVRVRDDLGSPVIQGFYAGGVLPDGVDEDDLDKHMRKGMVAEAGSKEAEQATPFGQAVQFDELGNPMTREQIAAAEQRRADRAAGKPHGNASRDQWAKWAAGKGATAAETRPEKDGGLSREDLRARYGS